MSTSSLSSLSRWKKTAYGSGDLSFSLLTTAMALLYFDFLVNVAGVAPQLAGLSIGIGRIYDALNDVVIGTLSDRTRSRWGRRRPYLLFGTVPFAVSFIFMWLSPHMNGQFALAIYYTVMYMLFDTFFTLVNVPYVALTPDLAPSYDERTSLHAYRMAFSIVFGLAGAVAPLMIVDALAGPGASLAARRSAYALMSAILAVASIPPLYLVFATSRERPEYQSLPTPSLGTSLRYAVTNRPFVIAAGVYLLTWIPLDLIQFVLVFLIRDCFHLGGAERDLIFVVLFAIAAALLPFWVWVAHRWSKKLAYQLGIGFLAAALTVLSFISPGNLVLIITLAGLAGIGLSAAHAIPQAILPDVIEWDELRSGNRYEAAYYSIIGIIQKFVSAATIALTGSILSWAGYVMNQSEGLAQPPRALVAIRFLTGPLPAVFFTLGIVLVSFYPISRERHARIVRALEHRRARPSE